MRKITTEQFISKAKQVHGDKYDYSLVEYVDCYTKVKITCPIHGNFEQRPDVHLGNQGCPECGGSKQLTIEQFISKAKQVHGDKYSYDLVEYINAHTKIKIICNAHGIFKQTPDAHLHQQGCYKCNINNKTFDNVYFLKSLTIEEDSIEVDGKIQCRCSYCKKYFIPTRRQLMYRIRCLSNKQNGENRLYCSNECKQQCPIFNRTKYPKNFKPDASRPDQPELRQLTLERDNFTCQRCGSSEDLHCHHITGVEINPTESADIDNCITLCYTCHSRTHSENGCHYSDMIRQPCVV